MSLKDQMAEDLAKVLAGDEFDEEGTYYPKGSADGFSLRLVRGDVNTGAATFEQGSEQTRSCEAVLTRAVVRAGIETLLGTARDPMREDKILLSDGTWYITAPGAIDVGGGVTVTMVLDTYTRAAGTGAVQVR